MKKPLVRTILKVEFGNQRYYPENITARHICKLATCKSLTRNQLLILVELGYKIEVDEVIQTVVKEEIKTSNFN